MPDITDIKCPKCNTICKSIELVCVKCGTLLFDPTNSTVSMRVDPSLLRLRRSRPQSVSQTGPERTVTLVIRGMGEKVVFEEGTEIILGRADVNTVSKTRIDLTMYGAHERGVSREHAALRYEDGKLSIVDLGSVNGTAVNFAKLAANQSRELHSGDEVLLGRLTIVVNFESARVPASVGAASGEKTTIPLVPSVSKAEFENNSLPPNGIPVSGDTTTLTPPAGATKLLSSD